MKTQKLPDPKWKAQQTFIRAMRRGSKKHTTNEQKLKLLDAAEKAFAPKLEAACPFCAPPAATFATAVEWVAHVRIDHPEAAARLDARAMQRKATE